MKHLLKNLEFPLHSQYKPSTVKNDLLNHKHCGKMISCFVKHYCVHRSTKRNNKKNSENISFGNSHTVILKTWRRVNIRIQNLTIMAITVVKIKPKTYKMKDLVALS